MTAAIDITRARTIKGWMSRAELGWIAEQAQTCPTGVVEIGCYRGRSGRAWADHLPVGSCLYAVDHWQESPTNGDRDFEAYQQNLSDHIARDRVRLFRMRADRAVSQIQALTPAVDLVFIDGDHTYAGVQADLEAYLPLVRPGGLIAGHDFNDVPRHAGVKQAVTERFGEVSHCGSIWWVMR